MSRGRLSCDIRAFHESVTGSCMLLVVHFPDGSTKSFLVDCGLYQEKEYAELSKTLPFETGEVDFVLVTHNHVDHIGRLPLLVKNGYNSSIYCTSDTAKLLPLSLSDSWRVLNNLAKNTRTNPLYSESDVGCTLKKIHPCCYNEPIQVSDNISATFFKNGHLPGAAVILVQISYPEYESINLLFSGDYKKDNMFLDVPELPQWVLDLPLTLVVESTYGTMDSSEIKETFKDNVSRYIKNGGTVVTPVFSLGRAQEILYVLKCMQNEGLISTDVPIYFDGNLAQQYTRLYVKRDIEIKDEMVDFIPPNATWLTRVTRMPVLKNDETKIIITTSGMGTYGPAQLYIPEYISRPGSLIQFTGFTAEGTLGHRLKFADKGESITIGGLAKIKQADVKNTTEFSAHAKADELVEFISKFNNIKLLLVNHGEPDVKVAFSKRLLKEGVNAKDIAVLGSGYFYRLGPYGLCKQIPTEFK